MPDRRLIQLTDRTDNRMGIYRINREFTRLLEHTASLNTNYRQEIALGTLTPVVKAGYMPNTVDAPTVPASFNMAGSQTILCPPVLNSQMIFR